MDAIRGSRDQDTLVLLARDQDRSIRGVLHFVPCYGRPAMSLSFMRRDPDTPNGLTEFMVATAAALLRERGVVELSLNFAAFARWIHSPEHPLERALGKLIALGNPFFQIESLYRFNAKFFPRWEPRYLVYQGLLGLPRTSLAAMWAEGQLRKPSLPRIGTPVAVRLAARVR
jgi:lysyl-tRNA synthetase class 2